MYCVHDKEATVPLAFGSYADTLTGARDIGRGLYTHDGMTCTIDLD